MTFSLREEDHCLFFLSVLASWCEDKPDDSRVFFFLTEAVEDCGEMGDVGVYSIQVLVWMSGERLVISMHFTAQCELIEWKHEIKLEIVNNLLKRTAIFTLINNSE